MSINQNILLSGQNYLDGATVTGPGAVSGFALTELQTLEMWKFARFSNVEIASTYVEILFDETKDLQLFAALKHNLSSVSKWRTRIGETTLSDATTSPLYDSGWVNITPAFTGYGALPWGEWEWGGVVPPEYAGVLNRNAWHISDETYFGKAVRIDFDDSLENEFGYLQLARLWLGPIYQPSFNSPYGAKIIIVDKTKIKEAESGVRFYGTRRIRRAVSMQFELPAKELLYNIFGPLFVVNGKAGEVCCFLEPTDPETYLFETVYGNIRDMADVAHSSWNRLTTDIYIDERV